MDIYLKEVSNKNSKFTFPSLPERIQVTENTNYQSYDIIGEGSIEIPCGTEPSAILWDGVFHGKAKRKESIVKHWMSPAECKKVLNTWREKGTVLRLLVTGSNLNFDVTMDSFSYEEFGAYGSVEYHISFKAHKKLRIYDMEELAKLPIKKPGSRPIPEKSKSYTVVAGDSLWNIAKKYDKSGAEWKKIYQANQQVIENTAKKRGHKTSDNGRFIFPGEVLTIP